MRTTFGFPVAGVCAAADAADRHRTSSGSVIRTHALYTRVAYRSTVVAGAGRSAARLFRRDAALEVGLSDRQLSGPRFGPIQQWVRPFALSHPLHRSREHPLRVADENDVRLALGFQPAERPPRVVDDV